jgi:valyl-tRNA synthetase
MIDLIPINPLEMQPKKACICGCTEFIPEESVLDTWATSSVSPLINSKWEEEEDITDKMLPMCMRTQAHEIIRTWTFYTIVKSLYHTGQIPWKDIMICGFVMAKKGEKISKSKNNSNVTPTALIKRHSADSIRYWSANSKLGTDTMFSEEELLVSNRFLTKLWNAAKFCIMQLEDYKGEEPINLLSIDRWVLERLKEVENKASIYLKEYEIGAARHEIDEFFWKDFCDNYLEIVKDRLYKPEIHGEGNRKSAQYALYKTLLEILKLYAPYVPHITEEIYQDYYKKFERESSIHLLIWNKEDKLNRKILSFGKNVVALLTDVRKYKSERNLSLKEPIEKLQIYVTHEEKEFFNEVLNDIAACTSAKQIILTIANDFKIVI